MAVWFSQPLYISGVAKGDDDNGWLIVMVDWRGATHALAGFKTLDEANEAIRERLTWARDDD